VTSYYVYYRIDPARVGTLRTDIENLFEKIQKEIGVRGRWMRRRDQATTYMEVYESVNDEQAFETLLMREGAKLGLERHVERFVCA
jgi:hypothetical protein